MPILTRFSATALIRAAAILTAGTGLLYLLSVFQSPLASALGPDMAEGQFAAHLWAKYALIGGSALLMGSFLIKLPQSTLYRRVMLSIALIGITVLIVAQLPPLFYWFLFSVAAFSWTYVIGFAIHAGLSALGLWGMLATFYALEHRGRT